MSAYNSQKSRLRGPILTTYHKAYDLEARMRMFCIRAGEHTLGPPDSDGKEGVRRVIRPLPHPVPIVIRQHTGHGTRNEHPGIFSTLILTSSSSSNVCHLPTRASCSVSLLAPPDAIPGSTLPSPRVRDVITSRPWQCASAGSRST